MEFRDRLEAPPRDDVIVAVSSVGVVKIKDGEDCIGVDATDPSVVGDVDSGSEMAGDGFDAARIKGSTTADA